MLSLFVQKCIGVKVFRFHNFNRGFLSFTNVSCVDAVTKNDYP